MKHYSELQYDFKRFLEDNESQSLHPSEIAYVLKKIDDKEEYLETLSKLPQEVLGEVLLDLPEKLRDDAIEHFSSEELASAIEGLDSDDATDLVQVIDELDESKGEEVIAHLDEEYREDIDKLRRYEENQAGAWMQTELFDATLDEVVQSSIDRLKHLKAINEVENINQVFIVDDARRMIATVPLEDLILLDFSKTYGELIEQREFYAVEASQDIQDVAKMFEQYDLPVLPVLDRQGRLVGRITSDDIYDVIEESATEQIYNLAGVNDVVENEENLWGVFKKRSSWLFINLLTAILASVVIGLFDHTLAALIPLAILMPIVASMGGNAGTQTLTVTVRRIALGEIDSGNAKASLYKEIVIGLFNGILFAFLIGVTAIIWFDMPMLGVVIGLAMIINMLIAGIFGGAIPLLLKRLDIDPAIGSTVLLTTATDVFGFFSFLGLAQWILL